MVQSWFCLSLAIIFEVSSVTSMKIVSADNHWTGMAVMYVTIGLSFTFMAFALKKIPLAVAYATWESLGLLAIAAIGSFFFKEHLSFIQMSGILLLLGGVILVNIGEESR
ncbi:DMT family transporter [Duffyella gerundensis]|uniref:DMT family transporter n=1 Tax=Duffyella TaxID=3026546 RepID=UPI003F6E1BC0